MMNKNTFYHNQLTTLFAITASLVSFLIISSGCQNITRRGQSPDGEEIVAEEEDSTKYVGDVCRVWGLNYAKVDGIGLAVNLNGTGSSPRESAQRAILKKEMQARNINDVTGILSSDDTSLVILRGYLPPAIKKGDRFDVEVRVLRNSETTSLEQGFVLKTGLRPIAKLGRGLRQGTSTGFVEGSVLVDALFESRDDQPNKLHGWVLGGAVATENRPIGLSIRSESTSIRNSTSISRAINSRFTTVDENGRKGVANPTSDRSIELEVPAEYRHNIGRYLQVVMNIAFDENPQERVNRLEKLDRELSQPALAKKAALRLEAFGTESIPALKRALKHPESAVQFEAAQSLAYFDDRSGVSTVTAAAASSVYRWHALTALSVIDHSSATEALKKLLHEPSAETRYGAFRSLMVQAPNDPTLRGSRIASSFFLHEIDSETTEPMLHFSRSKRPEVTVFGSEQFMSPNFLYVEKGLTVKSIAGDRIQITKFSSDGVIRKVCSNKVGDLIKVLGKLDFDYGTQLRMFREAKQQENLSSRLVVNAVPRIRRKQKEAIASANNDTLPELFRVASSSEPQKRRVRAELTNDSTDDPDENSSAFTKLKNLFSGKPQ